ncbi:MAG: flagellar hook-associated protein FlgL [Verrucomicrobia bacterium]|nr:flagellar hook-associated protein FlgL [Verrucomicrobiota bacterium]
MRVTANTFPSSLNDQLAKLNIRQTRLHQQAATGQRIQNPEDDPSAVHRVLDMQNEIRTLGQYEKNIGQMHDQASESYASLTSLKKVLDRAQELTTRAGGLRSQDELKIFAEEVNQLIKSGVQIMNTAFRGDYLFSGTQSNLPPFVSTTDAAGHVTAVAYQGNAQAAQNEIGHGVTMSVTVPGANTTGSGPRGVVTDSRAGADLFNHLISLRDNLLAGNVPAIAATNTPQLAADEENLLIHVGISGATQSQLETAKALGQRDHLSLETSISNEADADLAQTITKLSQTQTAYQAALQSGGKILSQTLLDYLR